ncbi:MAG TPA: hypothetical protein VEL73_07445 [Mycobacteriales bacterium]|nr:hypothetical protein [Mycobacteriales bacterium]
MPDRIQPPRLATSGRRAHATAVLQTAATQALPDLPAATVVIDLLDAVTTAALRSVGVGGDDARAVLTAVWADPNGPRQ